MTVSFCVDLTCGRCKARISFQDERPDWKAYDYRIERPDDIEAAARFVGQHADDPVPSRAEILPEEWRVPESVYEFISAPDVFWRRDRQSGAMVAEPGRAELSIPEPYLYIDCPICAAHVRKP